MEHAKNLGPSEEKFKIIIITLFISTLLKLRIVDESQALFKLNFEEVSDRVLSEDRHTRTKRKAKVNEKDIINFLKAEIELASRNYEKSINYMLDYLSSESNRDRIYA